MSFREKYQAEISVSVTICDGRRLGGLGVAFYSQNQAAFPANAINGVSSALWRLASSNRAL